MGDAALVRGGLPLVPTCCHVGFFDLTLSISCTSFKIYPSFSHVVAYDCMYVKLPQHNILSTGG